MTRRPGPGHVEQLAEAVLALDPPLGDQERRMAVALYAALAEGAAVPAAAVAARAQVPVARVSAWLERLPAVGLVELDRHGRVTAFGGLSLDETPHRLDVGGHSLHAWCAWDPLFIVPLLGQAGRVSSRCPATGAGISVLVEPDGSVAADPPTTALSFMGPDACCATDVRDAFCQFVSYFADEAAAERWAAGHPGAFPLTLDEAVLLARRVNSARFGAVV